MKALNLIFIICFNLFIINSYCQKIENVKFEQVGNKIYIYYDLVGTYKDKFSISIYYSDDNGKTWKGPIKSALGDIGVDQISGKQKSIIWDVLNEKSEMVGNYNFKVEAVLQNYFRGNFGNFVDYRDNQTYNWTRIDDYIWMIDNLNYLTKSGSWCPDNMDSCAKCGRYYTWEMALEACPDGWHLPSEKEWQILKDKLKVAGEKDNKLEPKVMVKTEITKDVDFNTDYCGYWDMEKLLLFNVVSQYWTSTTEEKSAIYQLINQYSNQMSKYTTTKKNMGLSVRCVTQE
jgi:uncharacterized protein (TIGR02145 family)